MEFLALTAIAIGLLLIALLKKKRPIVEVEEIREWWAKMESNTYSRELTDLELDHFQSICQQLVERLGLEIVERQRESCRKISWVARDNRPLVGGDYLVVLFLQERGQGPVPFEEVVNLRGTVRSQGALKGVFLTNTYFTPFAVEEGQRTEIDTIDGIALGALLGEYAVL